MTTRAEIKFPAWLEIDLDKLAANTRQLKAGIGERELLAVVKADAYGHGAVPVARTVLANGATWLGVNIIQEALELRAAGIEAPILILGCSSFAYADEIVAHDLHVVISDAAALPALAQAARIRGKDALLQIKVDTGMCRLGVAPPELLSLAETILRTPGLKLTGVLSHFPVSDAADKCFSFNQIEAFQLLLENLQAQGIALPYVSLANSAGALDLLDYPGNLVRCGIALYGLYPSAEVRHDLPLQPILALKAKVNLVKNVPAGTGVSYGLTYVTPETTRLAVIPLGYAHGLARGLSNKGEVLIRGQRCPIRGRVCMDSLIVETGELDVALGDEAVLLGQQGLETISADELAYLLNTINYEIVATFSSRLPRVYRSQGKITLIRQAHFTYEDTDLVAE